MLLSSIVAAALAWSTMAPAPRVVTVRAFDFRFEAPATVPAGTITFRLENRGKEIHHLWIVKLAKGKTAEDFMKLTKVWGSALRMPAWATDVGGPNSAGAGESDEGTMTLDPGTYMLVCWIPSSDGMLHIMKGMVRPITVTAAGATPPDEPKADVSMILDDYSFELSRPLTPGRHVIRIENRAKQSHEAVIARLAPDKTLSQAVSWMNGGQVGPSPVVPLGGASGLATGRHMYITVDLQPGRYVLLCFIPDVRTGKPHSAHGMVKEITIAP